jgi:hypothetical protein
MDGVWWVYKVLVIFSKKLENMRNGVWGMWKLCKFSNNIVCPLDCIGSDYYFTLVGSRHKCCD